MWLTVLDDPVSVSLSLCRRVSFPLKLPHTADGEDGQALLFGVQWRILIPDLCCHCTEQ